MKQRETLGQCLLVWFTVCLVSGLHASTGMAATQPEPELLEAEKAFRVSASWRDAATVEVRYTIADGYYMYRDRFAFAANGKPLDLNKSKLPKGQWKRDATFGKVVTYRNSVRLLLPIAPPNNTHTQGGDVSIDLTSQGCADIGVCYPPLRQTIRLAHGATTVAVPVEAAVGSFSSQKSVQGRAGTMSDLVRRRD